MFTLSATLLVEQLGIHLMLEMYNPQTHPATLLGLEMQLLCLRRNLSGSTSSISLWGERTSASQTLGVSLKAFGYSRMVGQIC